MKNLTIGALIWGVLTALVTALALSAIAAALVGAGMLPAGGLKYVSWGITLLTGLAGGFMTAKQAGKLRLPLALATVGLYLLIVFVLRGLLYKNVCAEPWWIPIWTALGGIAGALAASGKGKNGGYSRKRV